MSDRQEINLRDGDGLEILPDTEEFLFKCCDCSLVHRIEVEHREDSKVLRFYREGVDEG